MAAAIVLAVAPAGAVDAPASSRPKIGVALGGGAAKGFAHIGVLRWLEDNRIPVDYIAGTSMGAVVGCAYSMGMSPDEIERLFEGVDWGEMFQSEAPFEAMDFRRKEDKREYPTGIQIGLRGGLRLPSGLIGGQSIRQLLNRTTLPYSGLTEFDRLPVPFRCVAVDIEKGEKVVLSGGSLSAAVRASMAIPGVFAPEEIDGRLLVDGGVLDNVPADVAREMGADIVIAVDVGAGLRDRSELDSLVGMLGQSLTAMMRVQTEAMLRTADIVLAPDVSAGFASDYRQCAQIAELGYAAAQTKALVLKPLALDDARWSQMMERRKSSVRRDPVIPRRVVVQGTDPRSAESIASRLSPMVGVPLEPEVLESHLTRIYGSGRYASIGY